MTTRCPSCGAELGSEGGACPSCGASLVDVPHAPSGDGSLSPTEVVTTGDTLTLARAPAKAGRSAATDRATGRARSSSDAASVSGELGYLETVHRVGHSSSGSLSGAREGELDVGRVLAGRYRVLGLLGAGGMGEVYQADDLLLGQVVAVKLLPRALANDPEYLSRLLNEVRVAREVSHPNVCRVHDIGEADGRHFLSMEYIDGEDLASLLRRIGNLSINKASELARQLCMGLHAAHERGVLHRDLKPANVMLDGDGNVRITDFGLAVLGDVARREHVREGTPAYMAPEQAEGSHVSARSDIYALGLVLYEIYTGRYAHEQRAAASSRERGRSKESRGAESRGLPRAPLELVQGLDEAVSAVIMRCLERDPARRPASALEVAAALPGGDPLAAALAAGYTPSADTLAEGGRFDAVGLPLALVFLVLFVVGLGCVALLTERARPYGMTPAGESSTVLIHEAREVLREAGVVDEPLDAMSALGLDLEFLESLRAGAVAPQWYAARLRQRGGLLRLGYRHGARASAHRALFNHFGMAALPGVDAPGDALVYVDGGARLQSLKIVPRDQDLSEKSSRGPPDWAPLLARTGFPEDAMVEAAPRLVPPVYVDRRVAWRVPASDDGRAPARIEAASLNGRPVYLEVLRPWSERWDQQPSSGDPLSFEGPRLIVAIVAVGIALLAALWIGLIAARSFRTGEGDRTGARRFSALVGGLDFAARLVLASHVPELLEEAMLIAGTLAISVTIGAGSWILYMVVEPYVRRYWPHAMISWSRVVRGRVRDPLVGRDLLIGGALGIWLAALLFLEVHVSGGIAGPHPINLLTPPALYGGRHVVGALFHACLIANWEFMIVFALLVMLRVMLREPKVALFVFAALWPLRVLLFGGWIPAASGVELLYIGILLILMLRFGILATFVALLCKALCVVFPVTSEPWRWYADIGLVAVIVSAALVAYGSFHAVGGLRVLDELLDR